MFFEKVCHLFRTSWVSGMKSIETDRFTSTLSRRERSMVTQQNYSSNCQKSIAYRVILVDFYWTRDKDPRIPLGHASLRASLARDPEIETVPMVMAVNSGKYSATEITQQILSAVAEFVEERVTIAFGAYVWGEELLKEVLCCVRACGFGGRVVLGGPQISYSSEGLESIYPEASAFIRGYGENALVELAKAEGRPHIAGVHWAGDTDDCLQANINIETIPSPWLEGVIPLSDQRFIRWETQRGCQYRCSFCQHREAGARLQRRQLDLVRIRSEIDLFCASGVEDIAVLDPIFNSSEYAIAILERFAERGYKGRLSLQCRAEQITQEFVDAAELLDTRLEFGLQTVHRNEGTTIKRPNHLLSVKEALRMVRDAGIAHEVSLIFGLPEQTLSSFLGSIRWCLEQRIDVIKAFPLLLLRGTRLDQERHKWAFETCDGEMPMVVRSSTFTFDEWLEMARYSEALKLTEGDHPHNIAGLRRIVAAGSCEPEMPRWIPGEFGRTA